MIVERDGRQLQEFLKLAQEGARRGAAILKAHFRGVSMAQADLKGISEYVSDVDRRSEETICEFLQKELPGSTFLGEETGQHIRDGEYRWIVDPLDGTTNYLQGFPIFAVSVALERRLPGKEWGDLLAGTVIHPLTGETWSAARGWGARKDGQRIRVGRKTELSACVLGTGFPYRAMDHFDAYLRTLRELSMLSAGIRRPGAAALDLCWTADGTFDGFWEHNLSPWDIAAGAVIIAEAGGVFTSFDGSADYLATGNVIGANPEIHALLQGIIRAEVGGELR